MCEDTYTHLRKIERVKRGKVQKAKRITKRHVLIENKVERKKKQKGGEGGRK